jgi:hypothetical protein
MSTYKVIFVGEQWLATGNHIIGSDVTGSDVARRDHVRNRKYAMRMRNRKFSNTYSGTLSPEVIVCACATGTFCITTRVVVQVHGFNVRTHILLMYLHLNNWKFCRVKSENMTVFMLSLIF